jgi:hypothetical protein
MTDASPRYRELARLPARELSTLMASSKAPDLEALAAWEWRGYNTPLIASLLGIRKFVKGFFSGDGVEGYNVPVRQNGIDSTWLHNPSTEPPNRFGFPLVRAVDPASRDNRYPGAALLDYGASPRNPWFKP